MRWSNLSAPTGGDSLPDRAAPAAPPLPLALPGAVVRTFDTPGFAGMTFYEVRAQVDHQPGARRVAGALRVDDQPLSRLLPRLRLLPGRRHPDPDGRRRAPGRSPSCGSATPIIGTMGAGPHRRYVADHGPRRTGRPSSRPTGSPWPTAPGWSPAATTGSYRARLAARHRPGRAPASRHLAVGDRLSGVGRFAEPPEGVPRLPAPATCAAWSAATAAPGRAGRQRAARPAATPGSAPTTTSRTAPLHEAAALARAADRAAGGAGFLAGAFGADRPRPTGSADAPSTSRDQVLPRLGRRARSTHLGLPSRRPARPRPARRPRSSRPRPVRRRCGSGT